MKSATEPQNSAAAQRLTVLWALNESGLGGILHAAKSPFTGLFVGGMAVLLVRLLAEATGGNRRQILKATATVLLVKFSVSPHSPVAAYLAVGFQGLAGAFILGRARFRKLAILGYTLLCYLQMSTQKIVTTTILYGMSLWEAIDKLAIQAARALPWEFLKQAEHASLWLILTYVALHLLAGLMIGLFALKLPERLHLHVPRAIQRDECAKDVTPTRSGGGSRVWRRLLRATPVLAFLGLAWLLLPAGGFAIAFKAVLRAVLVITIWYSIVSPVGRWIMRKALNRRASRHAEEIDFVLEQLPLLRQTTHGIWKAEQEHRVPVRLYHTVLGLLAWGLTGDDHERS